MNTCPPMARIRKREDKLRIMATSYFQAANYSRLQEWTKSAELLDKFFENYPDPKSNVYYPFALFDRANCYYAESEYEPALEKVTRVETQFPGVSVMEQNLALKGNILEGLKKPEEAEKYYLMALDLAEQKKNDLVAGSVSSTSPQSSVRPRLVKRKIHALPKLFHIIISSGKSMETNHPSKPRSRSPESRGCVR